MYMWAHPEAVPDPMDRLFFQTILGYLSDVHEKKASLSMVQVLVNQSVNPLVLIRETQAWTFSNTGLSDMQVHRPP